MASLFEQYEQAAQKSADLMTASCRPQAQRSNSLILPLAVQDNEPVFSKRRINFKPPSPISYLVVSNNQLALAMVNRCISRLDLAHPDQLDDTDLTKFLGEQSANAKIRRLFLDVTGNHLLICAVTRDNESPIDVFYLNRNNKKPRSCAKLKTLVINAVAWNHQTCTESSTGPILVGTNKGLIYETSLNVIEDRSLALNSSLEQYWKQVFNLSKDEPTSVTGLEYHVIPEDKCFVLVTTPTRLYQFLGTVPSFAEHPVMVHVFNNYPDIPARFRDIPSSLPYSELQLFYPRPWELPQALAWMTGVGIMYYGMDYSDQAGQDVVTTTAKLVSYPKQKDVEQLPLSVVLTEFHVLVLYRDRVKGFSILDERLIMEDVFTEMYGTMVRLVKDQITGTIWACSEHALYRYNVTREARHVWQIYLSKGDYDLSMRYCENDPVNMNVVRTRQAEDYFNRKLYEESAACYAKTQVSFEEITLKFLQAEQKNGLKTFLLKKLAGLRPQDMTQTTMIVIWLVELYLNHLGELRDGGQRETPAYTKLRQEFLDFLALPTVKDCATHNSSGTVYDLMASHGDQDALINFALLMNDFKRVIQFHLHNGNYKEALRILQKEKRVDLFYQFCPLLMQFLPVETVDACIAFGRKLDPSRLIPALVHYNNNRENILERNEAIRYLEFCVKCLDNKERTIHDYLLSLYAKNSPERLETYLNLQGQDPATVSYDLEYALRVCSEYGLDSACVHIYAVMGLYEEAVDLALKFDVDKAKQYADRPEENEDLRKKLWLKIAHHVVKEENDIKRAMEFLQQCDLIKIEDILPFFPNFVTIDHFKDAICQSLLEYNQHIEGLKEEMEEATQSTKEIRAETRTFRNKYTMVSSQNKCVVCGYPVLSRSFYSFPCRHMFHVDCLVAEVVPHLNNSKRQRVEEIQKHLSHFGGRDESGTQLVSNSKEDAKVELDAILAAECPYCGELMIRADFHVQCMTFCHKLTSVDLPFIGSDYDRVMQNWE